MECFKVCLNEIEGRLDPFYYRPEFMELEKRLSKLKHERLEEVIEFSNETWNQKDFFDKKFPYIEISEVDTSTGEIRDIIYYDKNKAPSRAKMIVRENDIIVSTTRPHRGAISLIDRDKNGFIASTGFAILRSIKLKNVKREFLLFFLRTQLSLKQMLQRSSGGNYPAITLEELKKIIIPLPSLKTQNRIVQIMDDAYSIKKSKEAEAQRLLDSINDYVLSELGIKMPELKDKMTFKVYADDVKGKRLDPYYYQPKFEEVEKAIEKGKYEVKELKDFISCLSMGISVPNYKNELKEVPFILGKNLKIGYLDLTGLEHISKKISEKHKSSILNENDVLFSVRGAYIGKTAVVPKELEGANIINNIVKISLNRDLNPNYLVAYLSSKIGQKLIYRSVWGGAQPGFTNENIRNLKIPLPPLDIQSKIAEEVKSRMKKAKRLQEEAKEVLEKAKQKVEKIILGEEHI